MAVHLLLEYGGLAVSILVLVVAPTLSWIIRRGLVTRRDFEAEITRIREQIAAAARDEMQRHDRLDGDMRRLELAIMRLPDLQNILTLLAETQKIRTEVASSFGEIKAALADHNARLDGVHAMLNGVSNSVNRHEQAIAAAAAIRE
jgi:hypothetical protein